MDLLAQMGFGRGLLAFAIIFICLLLMLVILLQKGRGGGLAGAFGGGGGSSAFGAKTGDVFTWITVVVAAVFILLAVIGNFAFDQSAVATVATPQQADVPAGLPAPAEGDTTTFTMPIGDDVDATSIKVEQVLPDGTVVPSDVQFELITEPVEGTPGSEGGAEGTAEEQPAGTDSTESTPSAPEGGAPGAEGDKSPPGGDGDSSTP